MGRTAGSGQGSIYKRGDKWRGQININGKRRSFTSTKKSDVIDWMAKQRVDSRQGLFVEPTNITVEELVRQWLNEVVAPAVSDSTYYKTENMFEKHLYPVLGHVKLQDLTSAMIQAAYPKMFGKKQAKNKESCNYCDSTIRLFASKFNSCLNWAVRQNILNKNPHTSVVLPKKKPSQKVQAYTAEEQKRIVKYIKEKPDANRVFYFLLATGMRVGEAIALTIDDVDLKKGSVNITKTAVNYKGSMTIQDHPKTAQSVRTIYLSENCSKFLRKCIGSADNEKNSKRLLFPNEKYNVYHTSALRSRWIKTCAEINIPYKGIHALRHTYATRALEKGIDIKTLSSILGHSSVVITMNTYQDVYSEQKKFVASIMNDIL